MAQPYNVLFLCTGNSARSILAEATMNHVGGDRFRGYSAGSHPRGEVHPMALRVLGEAGIATDGLRSKAWDEFAEAGAAQMDLIITVCDRAAGESCPIWPGRPATAHWGVEDPGDVPGDDEQVRKAFVTAMALLRHRISLLQALNVESLDRIVLEHRAREIGEAS